MRAGARTPADKVSFPFETQYVQQNYMRKYIMKICVHIGMSWVHGTRSVPIDHCLF
jgi:hypothetical protein